MSKDALARVGSAATGLAARYNLTPEQIDVIRSQVAPSDTPDAVIELFLIRCKQLGADPFGRLFSIIPRQAYNSRTKQKETKWSIEATIDLLRATAEATGQYDGQDEPRPTYDKNGKLIASTATVYRKDISRPISATAHWAEYAQMFDGKPTAMWDRMPHTMLGKCAEALALRKAFPAKLNGIYTSDEMGEITNVTPTATATVTATAASATAEAEYLPPAADLELARARKGIETLVAERNVPRDWVRNETAALGSDGSVEFADLSEPQLRDLARRMVKAFPKPTVDANKPAGDVSAPTDDSKPVETAQTAPDGQQRIDPGASSQRKKLLEAVIEFASAHTLSTDDLQGACATVTFGSDSGIRYEFTTLSDAELAELLVYLGGPPR